MSAFLEQSYWISLAHLPRWGSEKINRLIIKIHQKNLKIYEFYDLSESEWERDYELQLNDLKDLVIAKKNLANNSFLAESLLSQGFDLIPITSNEYPKTLKDNLKTKLSPPLLYTKGNKQIFEEKSIAIVGSRDASEISLRFTDNIAKLASKEFKVVVSGFAKGIDQQALDSALKYQGRSIIVLPQGILTFSTGIKKYYTQIVEGNIIVVSTFHPKAIWSAGLAMARNPIIYGLAKDIYVAQSSDKGGTWEGVMKGLKMGRKIYVRQPEENENIANTQLINLGATPVDFDGKEIVKYKEVPQENELVKEPIIAEKEIGVDDVLNLLRESTISISAKEISAKFNGRINSQKVNNMLKNVSSVTKVKGKPIKYAIVTQEGTLFGNLDEEKIPRMALEVIDDDVIPNAELEILSPEFDWSSDWKFLYLGNIIKVKIDDAVFIGNVNNRNFGFTKGDIIYADIKLIDKSSLERYQLIKVIKVKLKYSDSE